MGWLWYSDVCMSISPSICLGFSGPILISLWHVIKLKLGFFVGHSRQLLPVLKWRLKFLFYRVSMGIEDVHVSRIFDFLQFWENNRFKNCWPYVSFEEILQSRYMVCPFNSTQTFQATTFVDNLKIDVLQGFWFLTIF